MAQSLAIRNLSGRYIITNPVMHYNLKAQMSGLNSGKVYPFEKKCRRLKSFSLLGAKLLYPKIVNEVASIRNQGTLEFEFLVEP